MRTKLTLTLITLAALIVTSSAAAVVLDDKVNPHYKGGSSFNLAGAGPNVARCGAFPENVELSFTGAGTDTEGGYNTAVFSACTNTTTNEVFDLKATDTYAGSGDSVFIEGDRFVPESGHLRRLERSRRPLPRRRRHGNLRRRHRHRPLQHHE